MTLTIGDSNHVHRIDLDIQIYSFVIILWHSVYPRLKFDLV